MNVSLYEAGAAMNASTRWQEVLANNLVSSSVPFARKQQVTFHAVEAGLAPGLQGSSENHHLLPAAVTSTTFQAGPLYPTGGQTDLGLQGPGFLEVQLPDGTSAYCRDGGLHLTPQGQLVTKQGYAVLGDSGPLQLNPRSTTPLSIGGDGVIRQGGVIKGRLRLVEFQDPGLLQPIGAGCFVANDPKLQATPAQATQVHQGSLEGANSSPTTEMASLLTSMRMFEANQKVMQAQDERMGKVISDLGSPS
jgi:flagellar basal-body rod protein FlgF